MVSHRAVLKEMVKNKNPNNLVRNLTRPCKRLEINCIEKCQKPTAISITSGHMMKCTRLQNWSKVVRYLITDEKSVKYCNGLLWLIATLVPFNTVHHLAIQNKTSNKSISYLINYYLFTLI